MATVRKKALKVRSLLLCTFLFDGSAAARYSRQKPTQMDSCAALMRRGFLGGLLYTLNSFLALWSVS